MLEESKTIISKDDSYTTQGRERGRIAMISTHGYVAAEPPLGMPDTGGQVVFVIELSKMLAELGYVVDIWTRQFDDQPEREKVAENVEIRRVPCGGPDFIPKEYLYKSLTEYTSKAKKIIAEENISYDFINSHYWDAGLVGQSLSQHLETPHVHTPHSIGSWKRKQMEEDFPEDKAAFEKTYNFTERIRNEQAIYRECDTLVATTPIQVDLFESDYDISSKKIVMIPPGYDDSRFYPVSAASREVIRDHMGFSGKQVVTSIGRLSRNKGFDLLVDAFAVAAERNPNAYLFMALGTETDETTEDPMLEEIVAKVKDHGIEDRVTIGSSLPDDAMADFYRASDVFCLPSRYEPFGMTAVEAMACGTPTVVTTNGGLYRTLVYGSEALYADSFDPHDFGLSIAKILKFKNLSDRLSDKGAHKARSLFTWSGIAQQLINAVHASKAPKLSFV
ncbi:glycosyltransferase [Pelagicoccus sp. SDUM812003]|uniref:glycosyltransferase n=1 Tax=Pelagicoccus sp. SDUM812003 TaxID=3041267 RepID=UPI00280F89E4|nr:glycosyltransferase [Pelagicoccus sp. SDUM812003]MDQ8204648.1 glycosyltransferase [Pelagicoccus sp. SDUM812003]